MAQQRGETGRVLQHQVPERAWPPWLDPARPSRGAVSSGGRLHRPSIWGRPAMGPQCRRDRPARVVLRLDPAHA